MVKDVHALKDGEYRIVPQSRGLGRQRPLVLVLLRTRVLACYLGKSNEGEGKDSKCNKTSHSLRNASMSGLITWLLDGGLMPFEGSYRTLTLMGLI